MNYCILLGRLLENPEQSFFNDGTTVTEVKIEFYQFSTAKFPHAILIAWDEIAENLATNYHLDDYLIIEGSLNIRNEMFDTTIPTLYNKDLEILVYNTHPIVLNDTKLRFSYLFK